MNGGGAPPAGSEMTGTLCEGEGEVRTMMDGGEGGLERIGVDGPAVGVDFGGEEGVEIVGITIAGRGAEGEVGMMVGVVRGG